MRAKRVDPRVGERLKEELDIKGISYQELADMIHTSKQTIANITSGRNNLTEDNAELISRILNVRKEYLLDASDNCRTNEEYELEKHYRDLFGDIKSTILSIASENIFYGFYSMEEKILENGEIDYCVTNKTQITHPCVYHFTKSEMNRFVFFMDSIISNSVENLCRFCNNIEYLPAKEGDSMND